MGLLDDLWNQLSLGGGEAPPRTSNAPPNAAGVKETAGRATGANKLPVPAGTRTVAPLGSIPKITAVPPKGPIMTPPNLLGEVGRSILNPASLALTSAFHSEKLGVAELDPEYIKNNRPEDWTPATMAIQSELDSADTTYQTEHKKEVSDVEQRIQILKDAGVSGNIVESAEADLKKIQSAPSAADEYITTKTEELNAVQADIDQLVSTHSGSLETLKVVEQPLQLLSEKKAALQSQIDDAGRVKVYRSDQFKVKRQQEEDLKKLATGVTPDELRTLQKELTPEQEAAAKRIAEAASRQSEETGLPPKDTLVEAEESGLFGDFFESKAFKRALIYYMGSRLMGYSASGSGMAAGQVLMQGWESQDKLAAAGAKTKADAAAKKAEAKAIDYTKSTFKWDPKTRQRIAGYSSKDGSQFYFKEDGKFGQVNPLERGWEDYKSSQHKTSEENIESLVDYLGSSSLKILEREQSGVEDMNLEGQMAYAVDNQALREAANYVDDLAAQGVNIDTSRVRSMVDNAVQDQIRAAKTGKAVGSQDLVGHMRRRILTADIIDGMDKGAFSIPNGEVGYNAWSETIKLVDESKPQGASDVAALKLLYKEYKAEIEKPDRRKYWTNMAKESQGDDPSQHSTPFMMWIKSNA